MATNTDPQRAEELRRAYEMGNRFSSDPVAPLIELMDGAVQDARAAGVKDGLRMIEQKHDSRATVIAALVVAAMNAKDGAIPVLADYLEESGLLEQLSARCVEKAVHDQPYGRKLVDALEGDVTAIPIHQVGLLMTPGFSLLSVKPFVTQLGGRASGENGEHSGFEIKITKPIEDGEVFGEEEEYALNIQTVPIDEDIPPSDTIVMSRVASIGDGLIPSECDTQACEETATVATEEWGPLCNACYTARLYDREGGTG